MPQEASILLYHPSLRSSVTPSLNNTGARVLSSLPHQTSKPVTCFGYQNRSTTPKIFCVRFPLERMNNYEVRESSICAVEDLSFHLVGATGETKRGTRTRGRRCLIDRVRKSMIAFLVFQLLQKQVPRTHVEPTSKAVSHASGMCKHST